MFSMNKETFLEVFVSELRRLEEVEKVTQLGEEGRYKEIDEKVSTLNYLWLNEYMQNRERETIKVSDLPKCYLVTSLIFLSHSSYSEMEFFENWEKLLDELESLGSFGKLIATRLEEIYINYDKSFSKFMEGKI